MGASIVDMRHALIVCPDPGLVQQVRSVLEERGYVVSAASNPSEARALAEFRRPSLMVIQVELGEQSGGDLARQLRQGGGEMPTILVRSAGSRAPVPTEFAGRVIDRPFPTSALARLVDTLAPPGETLNGGDSFLDAGAFSAPYPSETGSGMESVLGSESDVVIVVEDAPSLATGAVHALETWDGPGPLGTQELPAIAVEAFDENHPVSILVGAAVSPDRVRPLSDPSASAPLPPTPKAPGLHTLSDLPTTSDAAGDRVALDGRIEARMGELLAPGGAITAAVEKAVAAALADALPRLAAEMAKALRNQV